MRCHVGKHTVSQKPLPACDGQVHFIQIGRNFSSKTVSSKTVSSQNAFSPNSFQIGPLPPLDLPHPNRPKIRAFVFPSPAPFSLYFSVSGVFSWNCGHGSRPWTTQIARLGYFVKPQRPVGRRGSHKMTPDPNAQFGLSMVVTRGHSSTRTPRERKQERKLGGRGKRTLKFRPPPFGPSPFGPPPFWVPTRWASKLDETVIG